MHDNKPESPSFISFVYQYFLENTQTLYRHGMKNLRPILSHNSSRPLYLLLIGVVGLWFVDLMPGHNILFSRSFPHLAGFIDKVSDFLIVGFSGFAYMGLALIILGLLRYFVIEENIQYLSNLEEKLKGKLPESVDMSKMVSSATRAGFLFSGLTVAGTVGYTATTGGDIIQKYTEPAKILEQISGDPLEEGLSRLNLNEEQAGILRQVMQTAVSGRYEEVSNTSFTDSNKESPAKSGKTSREKSTKKSEKPVSVDKRTHQQKQRGTSVFIGEQYDAECIKNSKLKEKLGSDEQGEGSVIQFSLHQILGWSNEYRMELEKCRIKADRTDQEKEASISAPPVKKQSKVRKALSDQNDSPEKD